MNFQLEGKKKFIATVTAIVASGLALFLTPSQVAPLTQTLAVLSPLVLGFIYDLLQAKHDDKKEQVKVEVEKAKVEVEKTKRMDSGKGLQIVVDEVVELQQDLDSLKQEAYYEPFDAEAFGKNLETRAAKTSGVVNPATILYAAESKGKITKCYDLDNALLYWDMLCTKTEDAFSFIFGYPYSEAEKHLADDKTCPYYSVDNMARQKGIEYWAMLRNYRWHYEKVADLEALVESDIDWGAKLSKQNQTLFGLGALAGELLGGK